MIHLDIASTVYERVPVSAIDAAAPFLGPLGLGVIIWLAFTEIREAPRGRRNR